MLFEGDEADVSDDREVTESGMERTAGVPRSDGGWADEESAANDGARQGQDWIWLPGRDARSSQETARRQTKSLQPLLRVRYAGNISLAPLLAPSSPTVKWSLPTENL